MTGQISIFDYLETKTEEEPPRVKTCDTCEHFRWISRYEGIPLNRGCFAFVISPPNEKPDNPACEYYQERGAELETEYRERERAANEWWSQWG